MTSLDTRDTAGLDDVVRSVQVLARKARELVEETGVMVEREIAMALTIAEGVRDRVVAREALEKARKHPLIGALRHDVHRVVDMAFDAVAVTYVFSVDVTERILDRSPSSAVPRQATA